MRMPIAQTDKKVIKIAEHHPKLINIICLAVFKDYFTF
jgi:hypothetical protein